MDVFWKFTILRIIFKLKQIDSLATSAIFGQTIIYYSKFSTRFQYFAEWNKCKCRSMCVSLIASNESLWASHESESLVIVFRNLVAIKHILYRSSSNKRKKQQTHYSNCVYKVGMFLAELNKQYMHHWNGEK